MKPAVRILLSEIAARELRIPTLERRGRDCFDFHDVSVWSVAEALLQAYSKGKEYALKSRTKAFKQILIAADALISAIEGTTDQFEPEVMALQQAITEAEQVLKGGAQ